MSGPKEILNTSTSTNNVGKMGLPHAMWNERMKPNSSYTIHKYQRPEAIKLLGYKGDKCFDISLDNSFFSLMP